VLVVLVAIASSTAAAAAPTVHYKDLCSPGPDGVRHCDVKIRTDEQGHILFAPTPNGGYAPADIQSAYGLPSNGGNGRIVALFAGNSDYTNAESDLGVYRSQYGLPDCTTANGCFMKIDEHGGTSYPPPGTDEGEQALDMEMASASCPGCRIMLVEGGDMDAALATVRAKGVSAFSFSVLYGYGNATTSECQSLGFNDTSGLLVTGALGDTAYPGARDFIPAACVGTLAVGGTTLNMDGSARGWSETTWSGTGSGCSPYVAKPSWQTDTGCSMRMEGDVAAVADPGTGLSFYFTQGGGGWGVVGGTSAAAPLVAGALTNVGVANGHFTPAWIWQNPGLFFDITTGNNGSCGGSPSYFCAAGNGYDGPTGWGTPNGALLAAATPPGGGTGNDGGAACPTPAGSYSQSCTGCSAADPGTGTCVLTCASCTKINGTQNPNPSLTLPCAGTIANIDGQLVCQGAPPMDAGSPDDAGGDATAPPPHDGGGAADSGKPGHGADAGSSGADAAAMGGPVDDGGAPGSWTPPFTASPATQSSGCACSTASQRETTAPLAIGAGLALAWASRVRRRRRRGGAGPV
jgi:hypothetical protein